MVETVSDAHFLSNVAVKGELLQNGLQDIRSKYPDHVESVRGRGLLLGLQLKPALDCGALVNKARELGLLVVTAGGNVVRIVPALNIPNQTIEEGLALLSQAIQDVIHT